MRIGRAVGCAVAMVVLASLAWAQDASPATPVEQDTAGNAELDRLFQQMLRDPANLDLMFEYAQLAVQNGNYDAAIGTLSRMLLFNPNLPRVRLELGALYFQVGSYEAARSYLTQALAAPDMPPEIRERATAYLAEIDRRTSRSVFNGSVTFGVRWQDNANSGPSTANVRALGQDATLSNQFVRRSDWNAYALASLQHIYNFDRFSGHALESTAVLYGTRQNHLHELDVALAEVTSGPRFRLGDTGPGQASIRPYGLANIVGLGDVRYYNTFGGGIGYAQEFGERVLGELTFERREKRFHDSEARPFASDQSGGENSGFATVRIRTTTDTVLSLGVGLSDDNAREDFRASRQRVGSGAFTYYYDPALWPVTWPWAVSVTAARLLTDYDAPDPGVDPNTTRKDREWRFGLINSVPISDAFSLITQVERFIVDSNLPNFKYDNWALSAGLSWRF